MENIVMSFLVPIVVLLYGAYGILGRDKSKSFSAEKKNWLYLIFILLSIFLIIANIVKL